jgi:hypothetical protein
MMTTGSTMLNAADNRMTIQSCMALSSAMNKE